MFGDIQKITKSNLLKGIPWRFGVNWPGVYDGSYNEDYEYLGGENRLDQCNGGEMQGNYAYFITDNYPFVPRCLYGEISSDFDSNRHR